MSPKPDKICAKKCAIFRTLFSSRPRLKVKVSKSTFAFRWQLHFLSEHFRPTEVNHLNLSENHPNRPQLRAEKVWNPWKMWRIWLLCTEWLGQSRCKLTIKTKANLFTQKWLKMVRRAEEQKFSKIWPLPMMVRCGVEGWVHYDHPPPRMVKDEFPKEIKTTSLSGGEALA